MASSELSLVAAPTSPDGSSQAGNRELSAAEQRQREKAARRHGLYARSRQATRTRHYRAGRLLSRLQDLLPLAEIQIPTARAWCEHEVLAADAYAALMRDQAAPRGSLKPADVARLAELGFTRSDLANEKLLDTYLRIRSRQLAFAKELGLTPAAATQLAATATGGLASALAAQQRSRALTGRGSHQVVAEQAFGATTGAVAIHRGSDAR